MLTKMWKLLLKPHGETKKYKSIKTSISSTVKFSMTLKICSKLNSWNLSLKKGSKACINNGFTHLCVEKNTNFRIKRHFDIRIRQE